ASLKLNTNNLNNRQGSIDSNSLILKADIVDNSKGAIRTNQQLNAQIGSRLNNQGGEFGSGEDILLNSEGESRLSVDNSDGGKIIANKNAYLNTESIKNNKIAFTHLQKDSWFVCSNRFIAYFSCSRFINVCSSLLPIASNKFSTEIIAA
ncbi:hemagluttinin repeat protein, partial [Snodgrassella alvi SCGC AB-598-P14]